MGLFDQIYTVGKETTPLTSYAKFFYSCFDKSVKDEDRTTTFAKGLKKVYWSYQSIPLNGGKGSCIIPHDQKMQKTHGQKFNKVDCYSTIVDFIMYEDKEQKR